MGLWVRRPYSSIRFFNPTLRDYQKECVQTCLTLLAQGIKRQVVSLPVGSGKTVVFSELIKHVPSPFAGAEKVLVLAHRHELLVQARNQIVKTSPGLIVGIDKGKMVPEGDCDVIVASVPTLGRAATDRLLHYDPKRFKCIVIDEAHHSVASTYMRIVDHFQLLSPSNHIFLFGCSATVHRTDNVALGRLYERVAFHVDIRKMLAERWLSFAEFIAVDTNVNIESACERGRLNLKKLSIAVNTLERNRLVADTWKRVAFDGSSVQSTLVFAVDLDHIQGLVAAFRELGFEANFVDGLMGMAERSQVMDDFQHKRFPILVNCGVLTEGTDIPNIDCLVMARPTNSKNLYIQMVGRGLRLHPGKEKCLVLDFCDHASKNVSLVSFPSLQSNQPHTASDSRSRSGSAIHVQDVPDIDRKSILVRLRRDNPLSINFSDHILDFVKVSPSMFLLSLSNDELLLLVGFDAQKDNGQVGTYFKVLEWTFDPEDKEPRNITPEPIADFLVLDYVYRHIETKRNALNLVTKKAFWKTRPMSFRQLAILRTIKQRCDEREAKGQDDNQDDNQEGSLAAAKTSPKIGFLWDRGTAGRIISKAQFLKRLNRKFAWDQLLDGVLLQNSYRDRIPKQEQPARDEGPAEQ